STYNAHITTDSYTLSLHDALPISDEKTIEFLRGRRHVPKGEAFDEVANEWLALATDEGATYDKTLTINAEEVEPQVTWGTNPGMGVPVSGATPTIDTRSEEHTSELQSRFDLV